MHITIRSAALMLPAIFFSGLASAQDCTIDFDSSCPDVTTICNADFSGGSSCVVAGLGNCYDTGDRGYQVGLGETVVIVLSQPLESLDVFFANSTGGSGTMDFYSTGTLLGASTLTTNGDCQAGPMPDRQQAGPFAQPVDSIVVTSTGGDSWIDTFGATFPALPVELLNFQAFMSGSSVELRWRTASETNNAGFDVQVAIDGKNFDSISFVDGVGTTVVPQVYRFDVEDLSPGRHFFRLKQIDFDGSFEYSGVIETNITFPEAFFVGQPHPNPSAQQSTIEFSAAESQSVRLVVHDVAGRLVKEVFRGHVGASQVKRIGVDVRELPPGLYQITLIGERFQESRSLIVSR